MLIGYFKKLVIADRLADIVPVVMNDPASYSPLTVTAMSLASIYRYYADLSGYVDIALGSSLIIGIRLHRNFNRPFRSVSIAEFWQRWHITVTTWFRDYVYIPLARSARGRWQRPFATILTLTLIAFWHGAQWTWLFAGVFAGTIMVLEGWARKNRLAIRASGALGLSPRAAKFAGDQFNRAVLWGFLIFLGALVNSGSWSGAMTTWERIGGLPADLLHRNVLIGDLAVFPITVVLAIVAVEIYEWLDSRRPVFERLEARSRVISWGFYYAIAALIIMFGTFDRSDFIYFNF